jgi:iron complex transport system substrate-binding protein
LIFLLLLAAACGGQRTTHRDPRPTTQRIVTLAPNLTEIVYALGAGDRVVGTDDYSDYPADVVKKPKVGGVVPNVERVVALHPDLVLVSASNASPALRSALERVRLRYMVVDADGAAQLEAAMENVGARIGADGRNARASLAAALRAETHPRPRQPRVLFVAYASPIYVAGRKTFTGDILEICGAVNAATVTGWPQYSQESLLADPPDVVLHPDKSVSDAQVAALFEKAARRPRIVAVDENIFSRPGPRLVQAAHRLNDILDAWERGH